MLFFCIFGTDTISFTYKYDINFCQKKKNNNKKTKQNKPKNIFSRKIPLRTAIPVSLKKLIFILENMVILLIEKLNMIKKFIQSNTHRENWCD